MPRTARRKAAGLPIHVLQRGNNRADCFFDEADRTLYLGLLTELAPLFGCSIHAFVFMSNHVHMLMTPESGDGPSCLMKHLGQRYVQHFNRTHRRTGTLWEGRFKSHIVESETYLFRCQRYIELNPVRAGMVSQPWEFQWSSYRANAGLEPSAFLVPHLLYGQLARTPEGRAAAYRDFFRVWPSQLELDLIRRSVNTGSALGSEAFIRSQAIELGRASQSSRPGRPRNSAMRKTGSVPGFSGR
jgi:putative transposase